MLAYVLSVNKLSLKDVKQVDLTSGDAGAAFAAGRVPVAVTWQPWLDRTQKNPNGHVLVSTKQYPTIITDGVGFTPEFVQKNPDGIVAYLKAWLDVAKDFKNEPDKVADKIYTFYTSKGYKMSKDTFAKALARVEVGLDWPDDLDAYMKHHAEVLIAAKKLKAVPDWNKLFRKDFVKKAMG